MISGSVKNLGRGHMAAAAVVVGLLATAWAPSASPTGRHPTTAMSRRSWMLAASASGTDQDDVAAAARASKRAAADRLRLQAERAKLEAEKLEIEVQMVRIQNKKNSPDVEDDEEVAAPAAPKSADAAGPKQVPAAPPPSPDGLGGLFAGAFNASDAVQPPAVTVPGSSLKRAFDGKSEAALQLTERQMQLARERVFDVESFYVTKVEQSFLGTIFRGNLRGNSSNAYERVASRAFAEPELAGVSFLLLEDPIAPTIDELQDGIERRPVFLAVSAAATRLDQSLPELAAAFLSLATTGVTAIRGSHSACGLLLESNVHAVRALMGPCTVWRR